ncbi:prephenate/arogenate dehydrogenase family protein [Caulobacter mirabilis]|uniref:prephenate dehydrogenase n=1 Tax=Caulobacter mirabilis TaxID=69666 RepID=A0A2D2B039_9CAUL|nr:prephenate/arogenate dehydrogenase family protein [Caulobacter mirabilis]ATQ43605.1 cyclohexadienyl dehydrogenase [Caulobacter mirabilis]
MTTGRIYERMAVVGFGLIGSSVARIARERGVVGEIIAVDASEKHRERIEALGLADRVTGDIAEGVAGADLVVFAVPVLAMGEAMAAAAAALAPGATITDVGSVKGSVAEALAASAPDNVFVIPGHPIAGTENSGPDAGFAELFDGRWVILTPDDGREDPAYAEAVAKLASFWRGCGAQVEVMDVKHHDLVLAITSHLPHLIAYNIVGTASDLEGVTEGEVMKYSAGGFRDFTRIAASDPTMWRDIFVANKEAVLEVLGRFTEDLQALSRQIRWGEADKLHDLFTRTRAIRRGVIALGQESAEPNFGRDRGKH